MPTPISERSIARTELTVVMADYLERYIGFSKENAKSFAEDTIDSWHLFIERSDKVERK